MAKKQKLTVVALSLAMIAGTILGRASTPSEVRFIDVTRLQEVKVTAMVTREVTRVRPVVVTREVVYTRIAPSTPTAGPSSTPAPTFTPKPTIDRTKTNKGEGSYLIGSDIAPGIWRSSGSGECYLEVDNLSGDLLNNSLNPAGATFRIPAGDYLIVISSALGNCTWSYFAP